MKLKKARKASASVLKEPEETSQAAARSIVPLNSDPILGSVPFPSSQKHGADSGAHPLNPLSPGTSLQHHLPSAFAFQDHVTMTFREGNSHPAGGRSPRGVSGDTLVLQIHSYIPVIPVRLAFS